jgi:hypothetical protein
LSSVVGRISIGGTSLLGVLGRGPGYPYGILELGSYPSWQGGNKVWAVFDLVQQRTTRSTGELASDQGILKLHICFILL